MINGLLKQLQTYNLSALYYVYLQLHAITVQPCLYCMDEVKKTINERCVGGILMSIFYSTGDSSLLSTDTIWTYLTG